MGKAFDPLHEWLGIPPKDQPPHHYRLLGIEAFEEDPNVIENAADRQMSHVRSFQSGEHSEASQRLLNQLAAAKVVLLKPEKKAAYDRELRTKLGSQTQQDAAAGPKAKPLPKARPMASAPQARPAAAPPRRESEPVPSFGGEPSVAEQARGKQAWQRPAVFGAVGAAALLLIGVVWLAASGGSQDAVAENDPAGKSEREQEAELKDLPQGSTSGLPPGDTDTQVPDAPGKTSAELPKLPDPGAPPNASTSEPPGHNGQPGNDAPQEEKTPPQEDSATQQTAPAEGTQPPFPEAYVDLKDTRQLKRFVLAADVTDLAMSPDEEFLAASGADRTVSVVHLPTLKLVRRLESDATGGVNGVAFSHDGRLILTAGEDEGESRGSLRIWHGESGRLLGRYNADAPVSLATGPDGRNVVTTSRTGLPVLRRFTRLQDVFPLVSHDRTSPCWDAAFSPDGEFMVTAGGDGKMFIWRVGDDIGGYSRMRGHQEAVRTVAFSPSGEYILSGSSDGTLALWSGWDQEDRWQRVGTFQGHTVEVTCAAFSRPGGRLVSGSMESMRVWDIETRRSLWKVSYADGVRGVSFLGDGAFVAVAAGREVSVWKLAAEVAEEPAPSVVRETPTPPKDAAEPEVAQKRLAVPDEAARQEAMETIKEVFAEEFREAQRPEGKAQLAQTLFRQGEQTLGDRAARYVLFNQARELAADAAATSQALDAADALVESYVVEPWTLRLETLERAEDAARTPEERTEVAERGLALADAALDADEYETAEELAAVALAAATRARIADLRTRARDRRDAARDLKDVWEATAGARETLAENPDDPDANLALGEFLCFRKGDWQAGLPHLAKGGDEKLRTLAADDLAAPAEPDAQVALADRWLELAETADHPEALRAHAAGWYMLAYPLLTGLEKVRVKQRLADMEKQGVLASANLFRKVQVIASGSNNHTIYVNDQKLMTCRRERPYTATATLKVGDVIAVALGDRFDINSLWIMFLSEGGQPLFQTSDEWVGYLPANKDQWWDVATATATKKAEYAPDRREYVDLVKAAAEQAAGEHDPAQPIYSPLKGEGSYGSSFVYHIVTPRELKGLPKVAPRPSESP